MDVGRLLRPRSIAVVGASERDSYAGETLLNLRRAEFAGPVWGVNPKRTEAHGYPCFPSLSELPGVPDAVVVAIPAASVPEVVDAAGALGCGGAIVYGAGFGEVTTGAEHERRLREVASRHSLPVCGPNGNGIVAVHSGAAMWGDTLRPLVSGPVALVSQSGNVAVNALATRRGLRFHTVVSCGNSVAVDPAEWMSALAQDEDVRSIAVYLEADGDGALLCAALADCAERGVGVAVLKVGESAAGAAAAMAHTGAVAGDQRVFRALVEEAGAAWADDVHDLLEIAKSQAVRVPTAAAREAASPGDEPPASGAASGGLAILTCSGGDSALAADECARLGVRLPPLAEDTAARLRDLLPEAATVGNPLDYTALIWGDRERLRDIVWEVGADPSIDRVLVFYDQATDAEDEESGRAASWAAVREGIRLGAEASPVPMMVSSTLPELLDETAAITFMSAGVPAVAGLRTGLACATALSRPPADPARLREIAGATRAARTPSGEISRGGDNGRRWLSEHEAKELLRSAGVPVVDGRLVDGEDDAVLALSELGGHVAVKLSAPSLQHKADVGALLLNVATEEAIRTAHRRLVALEVEGSGVLVERMATPGAELLIVPCIVIGAGGAWTELLDDVAIVPLPATAERVERAIRSLRAAPMLCTSGEASAGEPAASGRGTGGLDVPAAARLAVTAGELLRDRGLELLELNPVLVHEQGAVAVDAVAARSAEP